MKILECDYLVVGSGIAGLLSALRLCKHGKVLVVTKKDRADSNTNYAQGGIACVMDPTDNFDEHVRDTLVAGAGLCDESVVRAIVSDGPERIAELEEMGVIFARDAKATGYDLGREGGHSHRRVLHAGDITGRRIEDVLLEKVHNEPDIQVIEQCMVIDLITTGWIKWKGGEVDGKQWTHSASSGQAVDGAPQERGLRSASRQEALGGNRCVGAYVLRRDTGNILAVRAGVVVLATGGGGKVYLYTSNPDIATGDGIALAWRAGVPIKNMEFIQFHPTCLYHPEAKSFLISEAVRGEGARLADECGSPFMEKYDKRGALAPRDIVARAIDSEMKSNGKKCVYLDIRHQSREFLQKRFPNIYDTCLKFGIDMAKDLIPVVPAAHYFCGGVEAGVDGATELPGLFACGEVACTGLHGANRLASNSLLEAVVCSHRMAERIVETHKRDSRVDVKIPDWEYGDAVPSDEAVVVEHNWHEVRTCMWDYVGIVRTDKRLERAFTRVRNLRREIRDYYLHYLVTADVLELRNIADVAELIIRSAQLRKESRGLHYTLDHPEASDACARDTLIDDPVGSHVQEEKDEG